MVNSHFHRSLCRFMQLTSMSLVSVLSCGNVLIMKVCVTYDFLMVPLLPIPSMFLPGHLPCQAETLLQQLCLEHAPGDLTFVPSLWQSTSPRQTVIWKWNHLPWNPGMTAFHRRTGWHSHKNISIAGCQMGAIVFPLLPLILFFLDPAKTQE